MRPPPTPDQEYLAHELRWQSLRWLLTHCSHPNLETMRGDNGTCAFWRDSSVLPWHQDPEVTRVNLRSAITLMNLWGPGSAIPCHPEVDMRALYQRRSLGWSESMLWDLYAEVLHQDCMVDQEKAVANVRDITNYEGRQARLKIWQGHKRRAAEARQANLEAVLDALEGPVELAEVGSW